MKVDQKNTRNPNTPPTYPTHPSNLPNTELSPSDSSAWQTTGAGKTFRLNSPSSATCSTLLGHTWPCVLPYRTSMLHLFALYLLFLPPFFYDRPCDRYRCPSDRVPPQWFFFLVSRATRQAEPLLSPDITYISLLFLH